MAGSLQELLLVLNASSGESGSRSNEESAAALAGDIGKTVLQDATHKELGKLNLHPNLTSLSI